MGSFRYAPDSVRCPNSVSKRTWTKGEALSVQRLHPMLVVSVEKLGISARRAGYTIQKVESWNRPVFMRVVPGFVTRTERLRQRSPRCRNRLQERPQCFDQIANGIKARVFGIVQIRSGFGEVPEFGLQANLDKRRSAVGPAAASDARRFRREAGNQRQACWLHHSESGIMEPTCIHAGGPGFRNSNRTLPNTCAQGLTWNNLRRCSSDKKAKPAVIASSPAPPSSAMPGIPTLSFLRLPKKQF